MNDLIERLRLGDGTSADHELLLEAADALEALAQPDEKQFKKNQILKQFKKDQILMSVDVIREVINIIEQNIADEGEKEAHEH